MKIAIIGCGNMGMIYARAFLKYNIVSKEDLYLIEKNEQRRDTLKQMQTGVVTLINDDRLRKIDMIILAVKPQDFDKLATEIKDVIPANAIIISIMAGITMEFVSEK